tara:strand:+ start:124 stop:453 length:330 start_codon:yes stop_codon:yes gene_type:complete
MDINYLKKCLKKRIELKALYPRLTGRHIFFDEHFGKLEKGIKMLNKYEMLSFEERNELYLLGKEFIEIRAKQIKFHDSRISTPFGNSVHNCEYELYSVALDLFQSYGTE